MSECSEKITNIFQKQHILYLIEDRTSGYDFFKHIIRALFPNTTSKFICCGNCTNLFKFLECLILNDSYSDSHYVKHLSDLNVHIRDISAIVLIRDICTASNSLLKIIQFAKNLKISIYTTTYYCFDQCFCQYDRVDKYISKNPKYYRDYINMQHCLAAYSYPTTNPNFTSMVNTFMISERSYNLPSTFEQCINMLYACSYAGRACVRVSKHSYD